MNKFTPIDLCNLKPDLNAAVFRASTDIYSKTPKASCFVTMSIRLKEQQIYADNLKHDLNAVVIRAPTDVLFQTFKAVAFCY